MLGNLARTTAFRVRNATSDRFLYHREHRFVPTEADVAEREAAADRTEQENRMLGRYLHATARAVGNRAQFDAKWKRAKAVYADADAVRAEAAADAKEMQESIAAAKKLPVGQQSARLAEIRQKTRRAFAGSSGAA